MSECVWGGELGVDGIRPCVSRGELDDIDDRVISGHCHYVHCQ